MVASRGIDKARAGLAALDDCELSVTPSWRPRVDRIREICADALAHPDGARPITSVALAENLARALPDVTLHSPASIPNPPDKVSPTRRLAPLLDAANETLTSEFGVVKLVDLCRLGCAVLCSAVVVGGGDPPESGLREGVRGLADALVQAHGGRSIEVRMPPVVAVQLAARTTGPTHRRGTPPNVVEMPPRTFLLLATGLLDWDEAIDGAGLTHSGAHAHEVAAHLPVLDLR